jgi:bacteriocin resistance YdeI/OmpD-like protein/uncharacterized protein DUF5655
MARTARSKSRYRPHPGLAKEAEDKERLRAATGRSFEEWIEFARKKGPKNQRELRMWLQHEHGHGSRNAWWLAATAVTPDDQASYANPEGFVDALYSGPHAALRAVHERVVDAAVACGDDVIPTSCKTMVPVYRKHVFVEMRPVDGAVEVSLALGDVPARGRLLPPDGRQPGDRLTHRVLLRRESEVDAEFKRWVAAAYVNGAGRMARSTAAKLPADLGKAISASPKAKATWDSCTDAMRRDWIQWIDSAKQAATREKRIGQALGRLSLGKKRMY